jgi:hypothetical protein
MKRQYSRNQRNPYISIDGVVPGSYPSRGDIILRMYGRTKPAATVAPAFIPAVPEKKSIERPVKKQIIRRSHPGISTGRSIINIR